MSSIMYELNNNKVIIYGAGMVGNLVRQYYEINGLSVNIIAFAVSNHILFDQFHNYPLMCIDDLTEYIGECKVVIATFPDQQKSIEDRLKQRGFYDIIKINLEIYQTMTKTYISNFLKTKIYNSFYDILYMASDNNCTSGAFLCLIDLVKDINQKGLKPLVVLPEYGNGEELLIREKIDYTYVPSQTWLQRIDGKTLSWQEKNEEDNVKALKAIETLIEKYRIRIVHCNTAYTYIGAVAAHNKNIFVVWHLREKISEQGYGYKDEKSFYDLINASDKIITVSNYLKNCYPKLDYNKTITIYDGVEVDKYYVKKDIFTNKIINIMMPAAIYPLKRQEDLVRAIVILKRKKMQIHLGFVGTGEREYLSSLQKTIDNNKLNSYVSFLGKKDDMINYYRQADIVVSCSGVEAFGRVCIEGALAGCLIIGADSGGTLELIRNNETGLLFEYKNSFDLAKKIEYAIEHPNEMRNIAIRGQKVAMQLFCKNNCSNRIYEIYEKL